jgi:DNA-directed RNA polymerase II subunit RPB2
MEEISWTIIDKYFSDNPANLVQHHLESYNDFFSNGIFKIFRDNNPIRFIERESKKGDSDFIAEQRNQSNIYMGGKNGNKIYFGKPIIYDNSYDDNSNSPLAHYMYPNDARLRNMTYGVTIHYDIDVEYIYYVDSLDEKKAGTKERKEILKTYEKMYLGRFPIMLQSNLCILHSLATDVRFNMGECRNDYGGYFIIDGKEKVIICQEKFADNMLYIRKNNTDKGDLYSFSAEIRSVSEDPSKPLRTTSVKIVAPSPTLSNNQIVVNLPNVRMPIPLFIVMRALGVVSDKKIMEYCLLDLEQNKSMMDLFIPSIHDANKIFNQQNALQYISTFIKRSKGSETTDDIVSVLNILMNYFLPHIGEDNFGDKAYFLGYMVNRLLKVFTKQEKPTDRDNFRFKRVELSGSLIYDLFREYYLIQKNAIALKIDKKFYYSSKREYYGENFIDLIEKNYVEYFKERNIESGFKKAFKGNWGSQENTKRVGIVQDINRLSWNTFISQLRKLNLPLDASAKVVGPRLLHSSQWGFIDPLDTPDGANIGLHKHLSITTHITTGYSSLFMVKWLRTNTKCKLLDECYSKYIYANTKVIVNGNWIGIIENPLETLELFKLYRRNGLLPIYTSIFFDYERKEIYIYTDSGRLTRPVYYFNGKKASFERKDIQDKLKNATWNNIISGFLSKKGNGFSHKENIIFQIEDLYPDYEKSKSITDYFKNEESLIEYLDTSEEESAMIATSLDDIKQKSKKYTHIEIHPSLILGVLGNCIVFPENNPYPRNAFSCGQSKQAVSVYHSNYQCRIDKMGVVLNYGQIPLIKSKYLEYINKEQMPYGINAIVAIMSYTGYNVEDAILINEGSVSRGIFRTTYFSMYEGREESTKVAGTNTNSTFSDVISQNVNGLKPGFDYSHLDKYGLIKENTPIDDKMVMIGKITSNPTDPDFIADSSIFPKKGQLGYVDKSFLTEGEEGFRIAKIRVREERIPAIGDKMASRLGQKGTIGLIIPEADMPFTGDGLRPDLIINPHAIPSRMTIGQLIESLLGTVCSLYGGFGDCTAFSNKGPNTDVYGKLLVKNGFHSTGNQLLYNGMTGEQLEASIFIGPTYYMRLKHMVKDKINYRALGPRTVLTRQTVQGRANDGGLRIGEMERDGIMAHGAAQFLKESFLVRGDEYYMAVCNKTGATAIYNPSLNLFLSPFADGPIQFNMNIEGQLSIDNISKFGRSFSLLRIPYSLKLLIQELQVMNVQMRIITEDNIDQLMNMSYSNNMNLLLDDNMDLETLITNYKNGLLHKSKEKENKQKKEKNQKGGDIENNFQQKEHHPDPELHEDLELHEDIELNKDYENHEDYENHKNHEDLEDYEDEYMMQPILSIGENSELVGVEELPFEQEKMVQFPLFKSSILDPTILNAPSFAPIFKIPTEPLQIEEAKEQIAKLTPEEKNLLNEMIAEKKEAKELEKEKELKENITNILEIEPDAEENKEDVKEQEEETTENNEKKIIFNL